MAATSTTSSVIRRASKKKKEENMNEQKRRVWSKRKNEGEKRKCRVSIRLTRLILPLTVCYHLVKWANTMTSIEAVSLSCITERVKINPMIRIKQTGRLQIIRPVSESLYKYDLFWLFIRDPIAISNRNSNDWFTYQWNFSSTK